MYIETRILSWTHVIRLYIFRQRVAWMGNGAVLILLRYPNVFLKTTVTTWTLKKIKMMIIKNKNKRR